MKLISALDLLRRDGAATTAQWIANTARITKRVGTGVMGENVDFVPGIVAGNAVYAFVNNGRWLAVCDQPHCDGCEYVDIDAQIFYCQKCGNYGSGIARPVIFPERWAEIEDALLDRPMMPVIGGDLITQTFNSRPLFPELRRDWLPGVLEGHPFLVGRVVVDAYDETPEMLHARNEEVLNARNV